MLERLIEKVLGGLHLSLEESEAALETILTEVVPDEQIAEFLLALSEKGESVDEVCGFARVMRRLGHSVRSDHTVFVDTAGTGGGRPTFNISTAAAFTIAAAGVPVAKHGNRAITSKSGSADVLVELGVRIDGPVEKAEEALNRCGICFMFAPLFHPAMRRVAGIRRELGRQTIFNMVGPLTNPAGAPFQVIGVYAKELAEVLANALARLGCRRAWVVHGLDSMDELSISADSWVSEVREREVSSFTFKPIKRHFGIPEGGSPQENAKIVKGVLEGTVTGPAREVVALNAAAAIHVATDIGFTRALEKAQEVLSSGEAMKKLEDLVKHSSDSV